MTKNFAKDWQSRFRQCGLQKIAAEALGRSEGAVSRWGPESGTVPGVDDHIIIAKAYGVSPAWLAWGDGPQERAAYERAISLSVALELVPSDQRERFIAGAMDLASLNYTPRVFSLADVLAEHQHELPIKKSDAAAVLVGLKDHLATLLVESKEKHAVEEAALLLDRLISLLPGELKPDSRKAASSKKRASVQAQPLLDRNP